MGVEVPMTGLVALGALTAFELASTRIPSLASTIDLAGHFGGLLFGSAAALLVRMEAGQNLMTEHAPTQSETDSEELDAPVVKKQD